MSDRTCRHDCKMIATDMELAGVTAFERAIRSADSDFAKLRAGINSCCKTGGGGVAKHGLEGFALAVLRSFEENLATAHRPLVGAGPFNMGEDRPSDLFAPQGIIGKAIWLLADESAQAEFQLARKRCADNPNRLYELTDSLLQELQMWLGCWYPPSMVRRAFCHLRFLVTLFCEWKWVHESEVPIVFRVWAFVVSESLGKMSKAMRDYEDELGSVYAYGSFDGFRKNRLSETSPSDRCEMVEERLLETEFSGDAAIRCVELAAMVLQFSTCLAIESVKGAEKFFRGEDLQIPEIRLFNVFDKCSFLRRAVELLHDSFHEIGNDFSSMHISLVENAHGLFSDLLEVLEHFNLPAEVLSWLRALQCSCNNYFGKMMGVSGRGCFMMEPVGDVYDGFMDCLTEFDLSLGYYENGLYSRVKSLSHGNGFAGQAIDPGIAEICFKTHAIVSRMADKQDMMRRTQLQQGKDIKFIKAEQDTPSQVDSKRRGPTVKYPEMLELAMSRLEEKAKQNPGGIDVNAIAKQVYDGWKAEHPNRGAYKNLHTFTNVVNRHWKRMKPKMEAPNN